MKLIVFEDQGSLNLEPISLTRPVFDLRYGAGSLLNRLERICPDDSIGLWVRDDLADLTQENYSDMRVNQTPQEETLWLNAKVLWDENLIIQLKNSTAGVWMMGDECLGALLSKSAAEEWLKAGGPLSVFPPEGEIHHMENVKCINYLWDLLALIPEAVTDSKISNHNTPNLDNVLVDETVGPVVLAKDVIVEPFSLLKGPLYIGDGSFIASHSKIRNSVIGPGCKIGGEMSGTIIQGNSNKVHDGFLGDSFLGEWVNIGAGTNNSNLKNNYSPVSMQVNGEAVKSGRLFLGSVIGDHTKTAIGTQLNTGTNIGVGCNVLAQTFPKRHIPSFTFCLQGKHRDMNFDQFIETVETVNHRRNLHLTSGEKKLLKSIYLTR